MKRRDILLLLGSSVFLVILWIIFSIIHQFVSSTINQTVTEAITPISPSFDISVINSLKTRVKIAPDFTFSGATQTASQPTPTEIPSSPSATPTLSISQTTPTATPGGTSR